MCYGQVLDCPPPRWSRRRRRRAEKEKERKKRIQLEREEAARLYQLLLPYLYFRPLAVAHNARHHPPTRLNLMRAAVSRNAALAAVRLTSVFGNTHMSTHFPR
jgi:hypothetical protein